uniref:Protein FAM114A2 n=1 Tax=Strigamia maritima TaxID=126957 RepID=T1JC61_STRMM
MVQLFARIGDLCKNLIELDLEIGIHPKSDEPKCDDVVAESSESTSSELFAWRLTLAVQMGDTDSDSFQSADEEDSIAGRRNETKSTKNEKEFDSSATFQQVVREIGIKRNLNMAEPNSDAFSMKKSIGDEDEVLKELERPWIEKGMNISAPKTEISEKIGDVSGDSCDDHPDSSCHCLKDDEKKIGKKLSKVREIEKKTSNVVQIENKTSTFGLLDNILVNVEDEKSLNVANEASDGDNINISPSGVLEMTSVLDKDSDSAKSEKAGSWGWSTWGSSILNTAATSGTTWGTQLLNTATTSGTVWGTQLLNTAQTSGAVWGTQLLNTAQTSGAVWGTQLLNTAQTSVSTLRSQVGEGLSTVLHTVESTFGAPSPEELAAQVIRENKDVISEEEILEELAIGEELLNLDGESTHSSVKEDISTLDKSIIPEELQFIGLGFMSTVSTGNKVIKGGLDTLEIIGQKTMDVIQDGDPGLMNKRAAIKKLTLSEVLREAKKRAETADETPGSVKESVRKVNYTVWFDEYHGLVSLEALELVSKNCEAKVTSILAHIDDPLEKEDMESRLSSIAEICATEDSDDDDSDDSIEDTTEVVLDRLKTLGDTLTFSRLDEVYKKADKMVAEWREQLEDIVLNKSITNFYDHYTAAVKLLAEITARAVELYHKIGELLLLTQKMSAAEVARCLADFTSTLCLKINYYGAKFSECHQYHHENFGAEHKETINDLITNVFLEVSNSCSFIQDSLRLVVPVLQLKIATDIRERS